MTKVFKYECIFVSTTKRNNMKTYTFNTDTKSINKLQNELISFVHTLSFSVQDFAFGKENELNVNGKMIQFNTVSNGWDFSDEYSVISLEKSISNFK
jgi:hypothetical protein